jgi:hypothetical protein
MIARKRARERAIWAICICVQETVLRRKYKTVNPRASARITKDFCKKAERLPSDNRQVGDGECALFSRASRASNSALAAGFGEASRACNDEIQPPDLARARARNLRAACGGSKGIRRCLKTQILPMRRLARDC